MPIDWVKLCAFMTCTLMTISPQRWVEQHADYNLLARSATSSCNFCSNQFSQSLCSFNGRQTKGYLWHSVILRHCYVVVLWQVMTDYRWENLAFYTLHQTRCCSFTHIKKKIEEIKKKSMTSCVAKYLLKFHFYARNIALVRNVPLQLCTLQSGIIQVVVLLACTFTFNTHFAMPVIQSD